MYYILKNKEPIQVSLKEWGSWLESSTEAVLQNGVKIFRKKEDHERFIRSTRLGGGRVLVSTVFLGIDHNFYDDGLPILFETMVFGIDDDNYQTRCSTYEEAVQMHEKAIKYAKLKLKDIGNEN